MILNFLKPIALRIPISLAYSYKLADIEELREKKHKNIVMIITISNSNVTIWSTRTSEPSP